MSYRDELLAKKHFQPSVEVIELYKPQFGRFVCFSYFEALYLVKFVFKANEEYSFLEEELIESIWSTDQLKYDKFVPLECQYDEANGQYHYLIDKTYMRTADKLISPTAMYEGDYPFEPQKFDIKFRIVLPQYASKKEIEEAKESLYSPSFDFSYYRHWKKSLENPDRGLEGYICDHYYITRLTEAFDYKHEQRLGTNTKYIQALKAKQSEEE